MIMSLKQKKSKFKPRIRLNHNKYTVVDLWVLYIWPNNTIYLACHCAHSSILVVESSPHPLCQIELGVKDVYKC